MPLSTQPPKGTVDWFPEEFKIRKYIFDTWRSVCLRYGYEEYLAPLVESAEVYRAKSGEDVGGKELMVFTDRAGRELSIRPEMTPSVTRMISQIYEASPKPIRYFSIANFMRNEKPQRGRNREFWQLNFDVFGSDSLNAEIETAQIALDIMLEFNPPKDSFILYINNRKLIDSVLDEVLKINPKKYPQTRIDIVRILDKWEKLSKEDFESRLKGLELDEAQIEILNKFMSANSLDDLISKLPNLEDNKGLLEVKYVIYALENLGYGQWIGFNASIIRGFDYYDGVVFEVFDKNPDNKRAMFGGGRYNGLAEIFGKKSFPAVGFAPGDETIRLFLESWGLIDSIKEKIKVEKYWLPVLDKELIADMQTLAQSLRKQGNLVELGFDVQKINKALDYANKKGVDRVVILGKDEKERGIYKLKDMKTGLEKEVNLN